jgi:hypothetical protein
MSLIDLFRQEYVKGSVIDKHRLNDGNLGLILEDYNTRKRYHVEFGDNYDYPGIANLFGLVKEPFARKTEHLDKLISKGDYVELTLSYSKGPFRKAYYLHSVYKQAQNKGSYKLISLPYKSGKRSYR